MQNHFDLLDTDVMPIFMIIALYRHNFALFYQLLGSNLFTHHNIFYLERSLPSYKFSIYNFSFLFTFFCNLYFSFHKPKIPKILLYRLSISIRSHFANNHEGIDNPFVVLGASWCLFVQVFGGLLCCLLLD